jgi:hypothetical protein
MSRRDFQTVLRSDFDLAPKAPCYRIASRGSAKPVFVRFLFCGLAFFLPGTSAYGAPQSQNSSLLHVPSMQIENCANQLTAAISPPLLISAHLAFYSPAGLAVCPGDPSTFTLVVQFPINSSQQQQLNAWPASGQAKPLSFEHAFWDRENDLLFAAVGASRTLDYFSTLNFRRRGRNEALLSNDIVDNHAAFASIEAAATVASIGVSYLFHRSHHHRLERWTSIVHAGLATSGAVRNYCLKTAHP